MAGSSNAPVAGDAAGLHVLVRDTVLAAKLAVGAVAPEMVKAWLVVPSGIVAILAACFGVDTLFKKFGVSFPASVACMLLLFAGLWACDAVLGNNRTRYLVALIDVPAGWSLRWISVLFTPTFITLPLSPPITAGEVGKMIAVFVLGFFVMLVLTAYMTRGLQLITGSRKKAEAARAEELGPQEDEIPIAETPRPQESNPQSTEVSARTSTVALSELVPPVQSREPAHIQPFGDHSQPSPDTGSSDFPISPSPLPHHSAQSPTRARAWAAFIQAHIDQTVYILLFLFVSLPIYYTRSYAMPIHLTITITSYFAALSLPPKYKQVCHPVLVSALFSVLLIWLFALAHGQSLATALKQYTTGRKYLQIWSSTASDQSQLPGAGDVLSTVLDASIVALALPMHQYRRELVQHFAAIIIPNILLSIGSLYLYPLVCFAVGISAERSLAFASRSLTLALAIPATENLGGDRNTVAAVAIMSGIVGALVGGRMLGLLRIPEDDYVTRGVTLGANSSAVATALLLRTDPRAAALSSLSMSLFGTITVLFTSIPPIAAPIKSLVGL